MRWAVAMEEGSDSTAQRRMQSMVGRTRAVEEKDTATALALSLLSGISAHPSGPQSTPPQPAQALEADFHALPSGLWLLGPDGRSSRMDGGGGGEAEECKLLAPSLPPPGLTLLSLSLLPQQQLS